MQQLAQQAKSPTIAHPHCAPSSSCRETSSSKHNEAKPEGLASHKISYSARWLKQQLAQRRKLITQRNARNHYQSSHRRCKEQVHGGNPPSKKMHINEASSLCPQPGQMGITCTANGIELVITPIRSYSLPIARRSSPARPTSPEPNRSRLEGSGTGALPTKFSGGKSWSWCVTFPPSQI